jgi:flagellar hook-length control protein FliK
MNNISGFSNAFLANTQFSTSDPATGSDPAASDEQSNAFGDVLAGLSQQGDNQRASSGVPNTSGWRGLGGGDMFSGGGDSSSDQDNSFGDGGSLNEATTDEKSAQARARGQNPAQLLSGRKLVNSEAQSASLYGTQMKGGNSAAPGLATPLNAGAQTRTLSGAAIGGAAASLISRLAGAEVNADLPASPAGSTSPTSKNPSNIASKSSAQSPAAPQLPAKTPANVQAPALLASQQQQAAAAGTNIGKSVRPDSRGSLILPDIGEGATQTTASSSTASTDRRRRAESDTGQTPAAPNVDAQTAGAAMAMAAVAPAAPFAVSNPGSQASAASTHGLPGANVDPAKATLAALDAQPEEEEDHEHLAAPIKVDAVSHTTHFAPVAWLSPAQQVVNAVSSTLPAESASEVEDGASTPTNPTLSVDLNSLAATARPSSSSLKTLDLQLDPQDLGAVSIRLNLSATGLTVEVQASQAATADLLEKDRRTLTDGLNGAGYAVSGVEISFAPSSGTATGFTDQGLAQNSSGQSLGSDSQGNGGSQTQDGSASDSFSRQNSKQDGHGTPEMARSAAQRSAGSGLYI